MRSGIKSLFEKYNLIHYYRIYKQIRKNKISNKLFAKDWQAFDNSANKSIERFNKDVIEFWPIMTDKTANTSFEPHYIYHPAWAARILVITNPKKHIDISSTLHFCTMVSAFMPVEFYDYRPANLKLDNLIAKKADLLALPFNDNTIESLSCMHTLEHIGLGRYGDQIDYDGDLKAVNELKRVLAINGTLLIVVPTGKSKIAFNAHRVYSYKQIITYFSPLQLQQFALVPDNFEEMGLIMNASEEIADQQTWGCGCYWFKKPIA
ncbi:MAG: hypothetical protein JWR67_963 [Mucilaginibacter sp.]|nr:hypothetical protein [Mucilaginibacter sp.]